MNIGKIIKELREEKGLSQMELSKNCDIPQATIARYELNKTEPTAKNIIKLADYFGVCSDYLLGRQEYY